MNIRNDTTEAHNFLDPNDKPPHPANCPTGNHRQNSKPTCPSNCHRSRVKRLNYHPCNSLGLFSNHLVISSHVWRIFTMYYVSVRSFSNIGELDRTRDIGQGSQIPLTPGSQMLTGCKTRTRLAEIIVLEYVGSVCKCNSRIWATVPYFYFKKKNMTVRLKRFQNLPIVLCSA